MKSGSDIASREHHMILSFPFSAMLLLESKKKKRGYLMENELEAYFVGETRMLLLKSDSDLIVKEVRPNKSYNRQTLFKGLSEEEFAIVTQKIVSDHPTWETITDIDYLYSLAAAFGKECVWKTTVLYRRYGLYGKKFYGPNEIQDALALRDWIENRISQKREGARSLFRVLASDNGGFITYAFADRRIAYVINEGSLLQDSDVVRGSLCQENGTLLLKVEEVLAEGKDYLLRRLSKIGSCRIRLPEKWVDSYYPDGIDNYNLPWVSVARSREEEYYKFSVLYLPFLSSEERASVLLTDMTEIERREYLRIY